VTIRIDQAYVLDMLEMLLRTPSPTGYTHVIMQKLERQLAQIGYALTYTNKGCGVVTVPGADASRVIGISAHVDTLGAMVRSIKADGRLRMTPLGGYMMSSVENEYCRIHTRSGAEYEGTILPTHPSVHVYDDAREQKREEANMEVRIDELVRSQADAEALGIRVGDFISFDPRVRTLRSGFVKSRHLDDKAAVAAVLGLLAWLREAQVEPVCTVKLFFSTYEEVGHGSAYIPGDIQELLAVDMGALGDDLSGDEEGVSICAKDSSGPYDYAMTSRLIELAERHGIRHAVDIYPRYGSDASAAQRGGCDIRAALLGPGVHASHGMERTHIDAITGTARLLAAYITHAAD